MSIAVILELEIKPEFFSSFEQGMRTAFVETRAFAGCISINACRDESRPNIYIFLEHWREQADYDRYVAWRAETKFIEVMGPMLAAAPVSRVLQVLF
jgi:quinol monooxygenase YgiN